MSNSMLETLSEEFGIRIEDPASHYTNNPTNIVIFGYPGTQKTGLAATAPSPLIVDFENGAERTVRALIKLGLSNAKVIRINPEEDVRDQLARIYRMLESGKHEFKTVVLDPIGEMQAMLLARTVKMFRANRIYENQPVVADYGKAFADAVAIMKKFRALPLHTVFVCHAQVPKRGDENFEAEDGDEIVPLVQGKNVLPFVTGGMDGLFYTTIRQPKTEGAKPYPVIITQSTGRVRAKNRGNLLPLEVSYPNLTEIFTIMDMVPRGEDQAASATDTQESTEGDTESEGADN